MIVEQINYAAFKDQHPTSAKYLTSQPIV